MTVNVRSADEKPPVASCTNPIATGPETPTISAAVKKSPPAVQARLGPTFGISTNNTRATVIIAPRAIP